MLPHKRERAMKNPFMSLWLSAANRAAGPARGLLTAEMRRQQKAIMREAGRSCPANVLQHRRSGQPRSVARRPRAKVAVSICVRLC